MKAFTLLPCPFCGGEADVENFELMSNVRKSVECHTEGCQGYQSTLTFSTQKEAAAAWNTRSAKPLKKRFIYMECRKRLPGALDLMTDEWIDGAQYSAQTVIDLRDALRDVWKTKK